MHPGIVILLLTIFYFAGLLTSLVLEGRSNKKKAMLKKEPTTPTEEPKIPLDEDPPINSVWSSRIDTRNPYAALKGVPEVG